MGEREPIRVKCEGSGCPVHVPSVVPTMTVGICPMCGQSVPTFGQQCLAADHDRDDILAMIDRGDFG